jgi:hypothetical protein
MHMLSPAAESKEHRPASTSDPPRDAPDAAFLITADHANRTLLDLARRAPSGSARAFRAQRKDRYVKHHRPAEPPGLAQLASG